MPRAQSDALTDFTTIDARHRAELVNVTDRPEIVLGHAIMVGMETNATKDVILLVISKSVIAPMGIVRMTVRPDFTDLSVPRTAAQDVLTGNVVETMVCAQLDATPDFLVMFAIIRVMRIVKRDIVTDRTDSVLASVQTDFMVIIARHLALVLVVETV